MQPRGGQGLEPAARGQGLTAEETRGGHWVHPAVMTLTGTGRDEQGAGVPSSTTLGPHDRPVQPSALQDDAVAVLALLAVPTGRCVEAGDDTGDAVAEAASPRAGSHVSPRGGVFARFARTLRRISSKIHARGVAGPTMTRPVHWRNTKSLADVTDSPALTASRATVLGDSAVEATAGWRGASQRRSVVCDPAAGSPGRMPAKSSSHGSLSTPADAQRAADGAHLDSTSESHSRTAHAPFAHALPLSRPLAVGARPPALPALTVALPDQGPSQSTLPERSASQHLFPPTGADSSPLFPAALASPLFAASPAALQLPWDPHRMRPLQATPPRHFPDDSPQSGPDPRTHVAFRPSQLRLSSTVSREDARGSEPGYGHACYGPAAPSAGEGDGVVAWLTHARAIRGEASPPATHGTHPTGHLGI